jgi:3-oxoisoapionate decarboxylase
LKEPVSGYAGICLDCANSLGAGEGIREVVETLAPYTVNLHLKEILIRRKSHRMGFDVEGKPFGQGQLPLEWILSKLTTACRTAILELWTPPEESIEETIFKENSWAEQSIRYLRNSSATEKVIVPRYLFLVPCSIYPNL